jgi:hypothetical protein
LGAINGSRVEEYEKRQVVVKNVAIFTDVHFACDPSSLKAYSVSIDDSTVNLALPMAPDVPTVTTTRDATSLRDQTPPTQLKLPPDGVKSFVPRLYQEDGETYAAAIVRAYKE